MRFNISSKNRKNGYKQSTDLNRKSGSECEI